MGVTQDVYRYDEDGKKIHLTARLKQQVIMKAIIKRRHLSGHAAVLQKGGITNCYHRPFATVYIPFYTSPLISLLRSRPRPFSLHLSKPGGLLG